MNGTTERPLSRRLFALTGVLAGVAGALTAQAQTPVRSPTRPPRNPKVAAPYVTASAFVRKALAQHFLPLALAFSQSSALLLDQLQGACQNTTGRQALREAWLKCMLDWERLQAVAVGPVVERKSARSLDFWPTRPAMIEAAIKKAPASVAALQSVGVPAKGLPALEWLLWQPSLDVAQCAYAALLADECAQEAKLILAGFVALQTRSAENFEDEAALPLLNDWVGQAVGGLEQLRLKKMAKPALTGRAAAWPRATSGATQAAWAAQWEGLSNFLLGAATDDEQGSLNGVLRGQGHLAVSAELEAAVAQTNKAIAAASPARPASVTAAVQALVRTKIAVENKAAAALNIMVGFTDADGD